MNFRLTAALFGAILLLGLVLLGLSLWDTDDKPATDALMEELVTHAVKADQITQVSLERGDGSKLRMERAGKDKWQIAEPYPARADAAAVTGVINALLRAKPVAYPGLGTLATHGLDSPSLKVTLSQGSERSSTLNLGDVTLGRGEKAVAFVTTSARPDRPMAVPRGDLDALFKDARGHGKAGDLAKWAADYRVKSVFSVDARGAVGASDVTALKLTLPGKGKELALSRTQSGWKFDNPAGWGDADVFGDLSAAPNTFSGVNPLLNAVTGLQALSADDFIQEPKDLKEYGLNPDNPDRIRVELKTRDGGTEVAYLGRRVDPVNPPPAAGTTPTPGKVFVQVEGQAGVIRAGTVSPEALAAITADPTPLRNRNLLEASRSQIAGLDVTAAGQTARLRQSGFGEWKLYGGPNDPQRANTQAAENLIGLITQQRVVKDFPDPAKAAERDPFFAGPELKAEVKVWTEGTESESKPDPKADPKAEPKLKGNPTVFQFGKKDAAGVYVRRTLPGGAKTDFILPEKVKLGGTVEDTDVAAAVVKTRLDFLDPTLKPFATTNATRLVIQNGPLTTEVVLDKTADPPYFPTGKWKFVHPAPQKDRIADGGTVSDLLGLLSTQSAGKFVAETPSEADLAKWGLAGAAPRLKVTVGLHVEGNPPPADADKERVYYFGNETDDKQSVYARVEGRQAVFTVPKAIVFDRFANVDLRDKTVLRFEKPKVQKVEVKGWYELTKTVPTTLTFERKGGVWTAESFPVDSAKVDQFLNLLDGLRAKAFHPGPPKPEHKFPIAPEGPNPQGPDQYKGLGVKMWLEGGRVIELNIGDLTDNGNSYFLWCGSLPLNEQVVTIQSDPFKSFKEKPATFAK